MKILMYILPVLFLSLIDLQSQASGHLFDDSQVAVIHITADPEDVAWMYMEENLESDSLHLASVHFSNAYINETVDSVGFRLRGNTSRYSQKKSFKLSFNTFVDGREFYGVDKLNLNGEHNDPSIIRSKLCWDLFQNIGMTASRAAHAEVYINGEYYGLYISVEHVDDEFLEKHFDDDSGNLWKCLYPADLTVLGSGEPADYYPGENGHPYELKTNEDLYDYSQLARLIDVINHTSSELFPDSLEKLMDVPGVIKYFVMNVLTGSWDDYWFLKNNYYLYHHPSEDKFYLIPYDYDNTYGIDWFGIDWASRYPYGFGSDESRPLADRIMANAQYKDLFTHFLEFYSQNVFHLPLWENRIDSLKDLITPSASADIYRTLDYGFSMEDFHNSYSSESYMNQHVYRGLKEFINIRNNTLTGQLAWSNAAPIVYFINHEPQHPQASDSIYISAAAFSHAGLESVEIHFQHEDLPSVEIFPMTHSPVESTAKVEDADRWTGVIPPMGAGGRGFFTIVAEDNLGRVMEYPRSSGIQIHTPGESDIPVVINEFLAKNSTINVDEAGEYEDWIELYNTSETDIFLSGMYITDNPADLTRWQFPFGGVAIPAGGYLLLWCDDDQEQGGLHTNFKLDKDGEFIALVDTDGVTVIDSLTFGLQTEDVSCGRFPDGAVTWQFFTEPTPEMPNQTTGVDDAENIPDQFKLGQNYPNPFNPETVIRYQISENSAVELTVYNNLGQKVVVLVSRQQAPGFYSVRWNAAGYASGVYYYRIKAGEFSEIKKMILVN